MPQASSKVGFSLRCFCAWMRSVLFYEHWMIGVIDEPIERALRWTKTPPIRWLAPFDKIFYLADPFPWPGQKNILMAEEYTVARRLGHIVTVRTDAKNIEAKTETHFPVPGHLSFPYMFEEDGVLYAMPESCAAGKLEIFRYDGGAWQVYQTIFNDVTVADAMLTRKDGLFWISYTDTSHNPHDNLHLIYASTLSGPWQRHPNNPVQQGLGQSRNGGKVFEVGGKFYRPAQDCTRVYGGALRIMEITDWTTSSYMEKEAAYLAPSDPFYCDGLHTLVAWGGDRCLVDGMRVTFSWRLLFAKLAQRLHIF